MAQTPDAVYLHIGHGKTGSSFLQSALALSQPALADRGIAYPIDPAVAEAARRGHITGGNLRAAPGALAEMVAGMGPLAGRRLLISGESFFNYLIRHGDAFRDEYRAACGDAPLHVLCYLRDPLDHAVSVYQQRVKRSGYTGSLAESLASYDMPRRVTRVLPPLAAAGARLTVLNYSRHRAGLLGTMERWLELPEGTLDAPDTAQVNRSLTRAELELQRLLNAHLGGHARRFVADPLCNRLPGIRSETPPLDQAALAAFLERMQEMMSEPDYQALVPAAERPEIGSVAGHIGRFPPPGGAEAPRFCFSGDQLEVFVEALAGVLKKRLPGQEPARPGPARPRAGGPRRRPG